MAVAEGIVRHMAGLARLAPSDADVRRYAEQLGEVLEHAASLQHVSPTDAEAAAAGLAVRLPAAPLRGDEPVPGLPVAVVLDMAPRTDGVLVVAPAAFVSAHGREG